MMNSAGMVAQWFQDSPRVPHSARGSRTRKMVRKRAATTEVEAVPLGASGCYVIRGWEELERVPGIQRLRYLPVSRVYTRGIGDLKMRSLAPVRSTSTEIDASMRAAC